MRKILLALFAVAFVALFLPSASAYSSYDVMTRRVELAENVEAFEGSPEELEFTLRLACALVDTDRPNVELVRYFSRPVSWGYYEGYNSFSCSAMVRRPDGGVRFSTFWRGYYKQLTDGSYDYVGLTSSAFDGYHSKFLWVDFSGFLHGILGFFGL